MMKLLHRWISIVLIVGMVMMHIAPLGLAESVLVMPQNLRVIEAEAFYGNTGIDRVVLSDNVLSIGARAFANSSIREIYIPESVCEIAYDAFYGAEDVIIRAKPDSYAYLWEA